MTAALGLAVMAGGQNTRLEPLSSTAYKPFLPIHGISMVARQLGRAALTGVSEAVVVVDAVDPVLTSFVEEADNETLRVSLLEVAGTTADKITAVAERWPRFQPLLVCLGDTFARVDFNRLARAAAGSGTDSAIVLARYRLPFGVVEVLEDRATSFTEKPETEWLINTGYLALGPTALRSLKARGDLAEMLGALAAERQLAVAEVVHDLIVFDNLIDFAVAHESLAEQIGATMSNESSELTPTKVSVSIALLDGDDKVLAVKRPDDPDDDLAGVWGLPAISLDPGESLEDGALRIGREKLGVEVSIGRRIGECTHDRGWGVLRLVDFEARITSGVPSVPRPDGTKTQYVDCFFTSDFEMLIPAARMGSQCTQLFLDDRGVEWRS